MNPTKSNSSIKNDSFGFQLISFNRSKHTQNSPISNESETCSFEKVTSIRRSLSSLTYPETDQERRTIQLWKYKNSMIASVREESGAIFFVTGKNIHNSLSPRDKESDLLRKLEVAGLRRWRFAYLKDSKKLYIWPRLIAAGKDGIWVPPSFTDNPSQLGHMFREIKGHLSKDTPENRAVIQSAVQSKENFVGTSDAGDCFLKKLPDGTQSWAIVKNGKIIKGGLNHQPAKFIAGKKDIVRWENRFNVIHPNHSPIGGPGNSSKGRMPTSNVNHKQSDILGRSNNCNKQDLI